MSKPPNEARESWLGNARQYWREHKSGMTAVRRTICDVILEQEGPFDAERLLERCRQHDGLISLSTVYRTLRSLVEAELLSEIDGADGKHVFRVMYRREMGESTLVCLDCNEVIPLENPCLALRETQSARQMGFTPKKLSLRMETSCDEFSKTGECQRKKQ